MKKKWATGDIFWAGVFVTIGLLLILVLYIFLQLWHDSTLRQLIF